MTAAQKRALCTCIEEGNCPVHAVDPVPDTEPAPKPRLDSQSIRVDYARAIGALEACVAQVQSKSSAFAMNGKFARPGREDASIIRARVQRASAALTDLEVAIERARQHLSVISSNAEFLERK